MQLSELTDGKKGIIVKVKGRGAFRKRITEMGFVRGKEVVVIRNAPLRDPVEYQIMGYDVSLRRSEAALIEVITPEEARKLKPGNHSGGTISLESFRQTANEQSKTINIALVGNPNCGKTSIFNHAAGAKEHVGNYSGVTVGSKTTRFKHKGYKFNLTDLPGTYSLTAYSPEEIYVRNFIMNEMPDIVINVIDGSSPERNLYLTTQLIDMDVRVVAALNMYDEVQRSGAKLHFEKLGKMLGMPIVPTIGASGYGINTLLDRAIAVFEDQSPVQRHVHINYSETFEQAIRAIQAEIEQNAWLTDKVSSRFLAIKLLEKDKEAQGIIENCQNMPQIQHQARKEIQRIEKEHREDSETLITDARYGFIAGALRETYRQSPISRRKRTDAIDNVISHKIWGFPVFFLFIFIMFQATFSLGQYPQSWIQTLVDWLGHGVAKIMPAGMLKDLLIDGVIGGVGGVIVFLPNILILFFFISLMEDTGYMARVAFIMDKVMHKIGLHGKSFIPLIMGFGCNVPAIMATRTLENRNDRLLTMLINPFMSCSARLPVYVLLVGAFFPNYPGLMFFLIYMTGIFLAAVVAIVFKKLFFRHEQLPFVMELPPYRVPTLKATLKHMWNKGKEYLKKMGGVILIASIIVWALGYFPKAPGLEKKYEQKKQEIAMQSRLSAKEKELAYASLDTKLAQQQQAASFIGQIGRGIEPVMRPLGFDWKMSVSILVGVAGKELVVSTMGVLYQSEGENGGGAELAEKLKNETYTYGNHKGKKVFTPLVAFGFMLFILVYFPCLAVIAAIKHESGSWKWALFSVFYTTGLAWLLSFLVYQVGSFFT